MSWRLIVPPTGLALDMVEARLAARVDLDERGESALDAEIRAAVEAYTVEAETETKRAVIEQTWRLTLDEFPSAIRLRSPPLLEVVHVKYFDAQGSQQELHPDDYQVDGEQEPGFIVPAEGKAWPATAKRLNAVEVEIRCGYGADHTAVPASFRNFIRARVAEQYSTGKHAENKHVKGLLAREVAYGC